MGIYLGIDPGKKGGLARLDTNAPPSARLTFYQMPIVEGMWNPYKMISLVHIWSTNGVEMVIFELCHSFPGISSRANASVMEAYGMWKGCLATSFRVDQVRYVSSVVWKKAMNLDIPLIKAGRVATHAEKVTGYKARKDKAVAVARAEFGLPFQTPGGRVLDGEAEAALLALYGSRL